MERKRYIVSASYMKLKNLINYLKKFEMKKLSKEETISKLEEIYRIGRYSKKLYEHFKAEVK